MPPGAKAQAASPENAAIVQGSRAMTTAIRPDLSALRRMPTLHRVAESWGKLELKLETDDTRYWLTTEGVSRKTSGMPINYVVDYVTVEKRSDDGGCGTADRCCCIRLAASPANGALPVSAK